MKTTNDNLSIPPLPMVHLLPYQAEDIRSDARFRWCCWSRQSGKSYTKSLRRILRGISRKRNQVFLSAGERQSRELMMKARMHCQAIRAAFDYHELPVKGFNFKKLEISLPDGVRIIGLPANPHTARGYTGDVFLDEFAMHEDDRAIWASMFPTLLRGQGELDIASTPRGLNNVFADLRMNDMFSQSTITLHDAIRQGLKADAEEIRQAMGDETLFRQEFLCEFLDEAHAFLPWEAILKCEESSLRMDTPIESLARLRNDLYAGMDIGRHRDMTVLWVGSFDGTEYVTRSVIEMHNAPFSEQEAALNEILKLPNLRRCCIDAGGLGMQLAENAVSGFGSHRVEPITFTPAVRTELAGRLKIAVEAASFHIPSDEKIRRDWHSLRRVLTHAGHFRLDAPRSEGSHADRFWAAALSLHAAEHGTPGKRENRFVSPISFAHEGTW